MNGSLNVSAYSGEFTTDGISYACITLTDADVSGFIGKCLQLKAKELLELGMYTDAEMYLVNGNKLAKWSTEGEI